MAESAEQAITQAGAGAVRISCRVQPRASKQGVRGMYGSAVKISLNTPPVDGKANAALCAFLADLLDLSKSSVTLHSGQTSRDKVVEACGIDREGAVQILQRELDKLTGSEGRGFLL